MTERNTDESMTDQSTAAFHERLFGVPMFQRKPGQTLRDPRHDMLPADTPQDDMLVAGTEHIQVEPNYELNAKSRRNRIAAALSKVYHRAGVLTGNAIAGIGELARPKDERAKKRRLSAVIGASAVAAVGVIFLPELFHNRSGSGTAAGSMPLPRSKPTSALLPNIHEQFGSNVPHVEPLVMPDPPQNVPKPPMQIPTTGGAQQHETSSTVTRSLTHQGDTIDAQLRSVEPKGTNERKHNWLLHKIMHYNHTSEYDARHMRNGDKFKIPRFLLDRKYIARHSSN